MPNDSLNHLTPAFDDPVLGSQACFRHLLDALAHPGKGQTLPNDCRLGQLSAAASQILLTLGDQDTPLWLSPALAQPATLANLRFHLGAPLVAQPHQAELAVVSLNELASLSWPSGQDGVIPFRIGEEIAPEQGATLLIECGELACGPYLQLAGPGLREPVLRQLGALPAAFVAWLCSPWRQRHFPCGLEMFFCAGQQLIALPRTTQIKEA